MSSTKAIYYFAGFFGSLAGAYLPTLWGGSILSGASILFSIIGGVAGVIMIWKLKN